ncbi:maleylpyruvate isomerase N-terminal domain-containing protein [Pseudonocardia sp. KRD291]|uniref:maleylpyruvate isomerase N-terminal domain-containing protein n=1 Tax=Pseudonocardia sp. KRD291 TaxID=2792007 RepID=UPI001C49DC75|nr:maleylpyruvate isomerase N-terminal domain-containing protein [Pseudonocardia sp. KRD291]MBW0103131.1 maleylpyruvate isomerase family mycothiol-dependent enzyme [Pseudonocardia sp. KRD291]
MDGIEQWTAAQQRVIALVGGRSVAQTEVTVPACPAWTVRDLFSHMVGLGSDVVAGDEPDDHNETWTRKQVTARADRDVASLIAEWEATAEPLREWMRAHGTRPLGDVTIHEQDLRGALGEPGAQDTPALAAMRDTFVGRFGKKLGDLPPIALVGPSWQWVSAGSVDDAAVLVRAPDFDLARAVMSRRSANQLRAWTERGDVGPYLEAFAVLGSLPEADLTES